MYVDVYEHEDGRVSVCVGDDGLDEYTTMIQETEYPELKEWEIPVKHIKTLEFEQFHEPGLEINTVKDTVENVIKKLMDHFSEPHYALGFLTDS